MTRIPSAARTAGRPSRLTDLPRWGSGARPRAREDLKQFQSYLHEESQKRGMSQEDLIEDIFQKCV
jgi:hypothetical protein